MEFWLAQNWFNLFSGVGIVAGLWFTALSFRADVKSRRISNLLVLTQNHQRLWQDFYHQPELARVLDSSADAKFETVKIAEMEFVNMVVQHLHSVYRAAQNDLVRKPDGLRREIFEFFSLPIPKVLWEQIKVFQDDDFVAFVESCRNWK